MCFPCNHVLQVIQRLNEVVYDYVDDCWKTSFYRKAHELPIFPLPNLKRPEPNYLGEFSVKPPLTKRLPGRPKSKRIKSVGELPKYRRCGRCGKYARHNKRTCTAPI